jgi:hypothetical protein
MGGQVGHGRFPGFLIQQDSSFSEEKEAKRLFSLARVPVTQHACK